MPIDIPEHIETVIVGGGQAGLAVGHHLTRQGREFVILDAGERVEQHVARVVRGDDD